MGLGLTAAKMRGHQCAIVPWETLPYLARLIFNYREGDSVCGMRRPSQLWAFFLCTIANKAHLFSYKDHRNASLKSIYAYLQIRLLWLNVISSIYGSDLASQCSYSTLFKTYDTTVGSALIGQAVAIACTTMAGPP